MISLPSIGWELPSCLSMIPEQELGNAFNFCHSSTPRIRSIS
jgi:hypothetical protein